MKVKDLIRRLTDLNMPDMQVVSDYHPGEYVEPQFRFTEVYRRTDPAFLVPSYTDNPGPQTERRGWMSDLKLPAVRRAPVFTMPARSGSS